MYGDAPDWYKKSELQPDRIRAYARKVAAQVRKAQLPSLPAAGATPVWLVALAPAEGYRQVATSLSGVYTELGHEGVIIGLDGEGRLLRDTYSYGISWPASEAEPRSPRLEMIQPMVGTAFQFQLMDDGWLTYLDVGRDRWHDVKPVQRGLLPAHSRMELNTRRRVNVPAKGAGLSRALKELFESAGGISSSRRRG